MWTHRWGQVIEIGDFVTVQIIAVDFSAVKAYEMMVKFDASQLVLDRVELNGDFFPGGHELINQKEDEVFIGMVSPGGNAQSIGSGVIGELTFCVCNAFSGHTGLSVNALKVITPDLSLLDLPFETSLEISGKRSPVDINDDGQVNLNDFLLLQKDFGASQERSDLDRNGIVNFGDFLLFLNSMERVNSQ